jgi:signal peptidase II
MTFAIGAIVFIADMLAKSAALHYLSPGRSLPLIPGILHLTLVHNTGAAFGVFRGGAPVFTAVSAAAIIAITLYAFKKKDMAFSVQLALGLIVGGSLGNLIDRLRVGHVIDFIDFRIWPVFNIADSCITIGAVMLAARMLCTRSCSR